MPIRRSIRSPPCQRGYLRPTASPATAGTVREGERQREGERDRQRGRERGRERERDRGWHQELNKLKQCHCLGEEVPYRDRERERERERGGSERERVRERE